MVARRAGSVPGTWPAGAHNVWGGGRSQVHPKGKKSELEQAGLGSSRGLCAGPQGQDVGRWAGPSAHSTSRPPCPQPPGPAQTMLKPALGLHGTPRSHTLLVASELYPQGGPGMQRLQGAREGPLRDHQILQPPASPSCTPHPFLLGSPVISHCLHSNVTFG